MAIRNSDINSEHFNRPHGALSRTLQCPYELRNQGYSWVADLNGVPLTWSYYILSPVRARLLILYNVRVLDQFWPPIVPCYNTEDAVRIGNSFITIPITRNYNHSQLSLNAVRRLHNYNPYTLVTKTTYSTLTRLHSLQTLHSNLYCTIAHKVS
jgi:hypothetical protein